MTLPESVVHSSCLTPQICAAAAIKIARACAPVERSGDKFGAGYRVSLMFGQDAPILNTGTAVAGVIGKRKFLYDLWGDVVNTASRMESQGIEGGIQITKATYELIKDDFICREGGVVQVKGKGEMKVWHVIGEIGSKEHSRLAA